jgi:hypothetical protein
MVSGGNNPQEPPGGPAPWWVAAAGGGGGITAAVLQDHALAWAVLVAFTIWLARDLAIAWITSHSTRSKNDPGSSRPSDEHRTCTGRPADTSGGHGTRTLAGELREGRPGRRGRQGTSAGPQRPATFTARQSTQLRVSKSYFNNCMSVLACCGVGAHRGCADAGQDGPEGPVLTPLRRKIIRVIGDSVRSRAYPPSLREMGPRRQEPAAAAQACGCGARQRCAINY